MGFKMLKDAGVMPAEVELMRDIEALRLQLAQVEATLDAGQAQALRQRLSEMQQQLSLRLEIS
jgi:putative hemolysin